MVEELKRAVEEVEPGAVVLLPENPKEIGMFMGAEFPGNSKDSVYPIVRTWNAWQGWVLVNIGPVKKGTSLNLAPEKQASEFLTNIKTAASGSKFEIPKMSLTSGTDPEIFVVDKLGDVIPAWEFLPSKFDEKDRARQIVHSFWDGYQAETCPSGSSCLESLHDKIRNGLTTILNAAQKHNPAARLSLMNSIELSQELVDAATDDQIRFRCTPSYNIYKDSDLPTPDPRQYRWRFAGGHLHIGLSRRVTAPITQAIVEALDGILGIAGVSLASGIDTPERRKMYGKCGEFRLPIHGIEYRVLSNFWLSHPAISHLVFELTRRAVMLGTSGLYRTCWDGPQSEIKDVVNANDVNCARAIIKRNRHIYFGALRSVWGSGPVTEMALRTIENGIGTVISDPLNIEANWLIGGKGDRTWIPYGKHAGGNWASQAMLKSSCAPSVAVLGTR
jgi:hypothetical protein